MKLIRSVPALLLLGILACHQRPRKQGDHYLNPSTYLRNEFAALDTGGYVFTREVLHDSLPADTLPADHATLSALLKQFLIQELEPGNFERYYRESSFADASTRRITFSYTPVNGDVPVNQTDLYVNPRTETIEQLYISLHRVEGDTVLQQKLLWKHGSHCMLYTTSSVNHLTSNRVERFSWYRP